MVRVHSAVVTVRSTPTMVGFSLAGHNASQRLTGEAEDKQTVGDTMSAKYFSPNYVTARTQFRKAVEKAGG